MERKSRFILILKLIFHIMIWYGAARVMVSLFRTYSVPIYQNENIYGDFDMSTLELQPQDVLTQTFQIRKDYLEDMSLAFAYDDAAANTGTLSVRFLQGEQLIVEQALPFFACPPNTLLHFNLNLQQCQGDELTVQVVNTSQDASCVLALPSTPNHYEYLPYTKGYQINDGAVMAGSILCDFKYRIGYDYYQGLTYAFLMFLATVSFLRLLEAGCVRLQRRNAH